MLHAAMYPYDVFKADLVRQVEPVNVKGYACTVVYSTAQPTLHNMEQLKFWKKRASEAEKVRNWQNWLTSFKLYIICKSY